MEIFENFGILKNYRKPECFNKKDQNTDIEMKESVQIIDINMKSAYNEFYRIYILNMAINSLCKFKDFATSKHEGLRKLFLECQGTWELQGIRKEEFEKEMYQTSTELPVDEEYFKLSDSVKYLIERYNQDYNAYVLYNEHVLPIENFYDGGLNLHSWLLENISLCNFTMVTPVQKFAIRILTQSSSCDSFGQQSYQNDLIAVAETGSGKTAAFLIPLIDRFLKNGIRGRRKTLKKEKKTTFFPKALILLPTQELAQQTFKEVMKLTYRTPIVPALIHGGGADNYDPQVASLHSGCDILVATPLRLIAMKNNEHINLSECIFLVLDESDRLLDSNFAEQTTEIIDQLPPKEKRTTVMFSATYSNKIVLLVKKFLKDDHIQSDLTESRYRCLPFHGDLGKGLRAKNLEAFKKGQIRLLIASDALSRGIDIKDITHVINYDTPQSLYFFNNLAKYLILAYQNYTHRIGRTARSGQKGTAITFVNEGSTIIMDLFNAANDKFKAPEEFYNHVQMLQQQQQQEEIANQVGTSQGVSQIDPYRSSFSSNTWFYDNPEDYTHKVETFGHNQERIHDDEYYDQ
uniref:RNA helicase n=1 Tax=Meloidogyne hapla TaxID=6305 RepID=A0A1I8BP64_MELHA